MKKLILNEEEIIRLYNNGEGCYKISKKFNCSAQSINNILKRNNIFTKKSPKDYRKYKLNENYFDFIDDEYKAYFLGFIYADGCLYKNRLQISLQEEDSYVLNILLKKMESEHLLYNVNPKNINAKKQKFLSISNENLFNSLIKKGLHPNKSLTINFPSYDIVPKNFIKHFIRGFIDGDGCIHSSLKKGKYMDNRISIISSHEFIKGLNNEIGYGKISQVNNNKNSVLNICNKNDILKLIYFIYNDSNIFLSRKKDKADDIIKNFLNKEKKPYSGEKIIQYDLSGNLIKIWENINEIKDKTTYNTETILRNIRGKIKTSNNYIFKKDD